jgi:hypothetical protein
MLAPHLRSCTFIRKGAPSSTVPGLTLAAPALRHVARHSTPTFEERVSSMKDSVVYISVVSRLSRQAFSRPVRFVLFLSIADQAVPASIPCPKRVRSPDSLGGGSTTSIPTQHPSLLGSCYHRCRLCNQNPVRMFDVICTLAPLPAASLSPDTKPLVIHCHQLGCCRHLPQQANRSKATHHRALCQNKSNDFECIILNHFDCKDIVKMRTKHAYSDVDLTLSSLTTCTRSPLGMIRCHPYLGHSPPPTMSLLLVLLTV